MSTGQTRVIVLLIILFVLEMALQPNIRTWLQQVSNTIKSNLGGTLAPSGNSQSIAQQVQSKPDKGGNCPPGSVLYNGVCYNIKGV